jgi:NADH-quinone oxidoreductase subunit N
MKELLITSLLGIVVLTADIVKLRKIIPAIILLGMSALVVFSVLDWNNMEDPFNNHMLLFDHFALACTATIGCLALFWFILTRHEFSQTERKTDLYALLMFSICGSVIMVSYTNLVMLFLGIEIMSIPLYVLAASNRLNVRSNEAGFKYFFLGSLASAILLFGIALSYGALGTFDVNELREALTGGGSQPVLAIVGVAMMLAGFAFKVSVAPFHFWAPDVYQGSPTAVTSYMATIVKGSSFMGLFKLFAVAFTPLLSLFNLPIAIMAALTLIMANLVALHQSNIKRLLAYSSVAHAGFMLAGLLYANNQGILLYYVLTYGIAGLVTFTALDHVSQFQDGKEDFDSFHGLVKRNPVIAGALTIALLSMAGIPPLSGFMAKYFIISSVMEGGYIWLVVVMLLTSVVSAYYYLKIIAAIFTPLENAGRIVISPLQRFVFLLLTVLMVLLFFGASLISVIRL